MANNSRYKALADRTAETADTNAGTFEFEPDSGIFVLVVTAQSGTTPTLDVDIEEFDPVSGTWIVAASFTQVGAATPTERITINPVGNRIRAAWVITGTAGTYSFSVSAYGKE